MRRVHLSALASLLLAVTACSDDYLVGRPPYFAAQTELVDFGKVEVGETKQQSITIINKGDMPMKLYPPEGDLAGGPFSLVGMQEVVAPGSDVTIRAFFTPADEGFSEVEIIFPNDSVNMPEFALVMKGTGIKPLGCRDGCYTPPRFCIDENTSLGFEPAGECVDGKCVYTELEPRVCPNGCDEDTGRCAADPCEGVTCTTPPNGCYVAAGACQNGACHYLLNDGASCSDGNSCTDRDVCERGSCVGVRRTCTRELEPECVDDKVLRRFDPAGYCDENDNARCKYNEPTHVTCAHGCETQSVGGVERGVCMGNPCDTPFENTNPCMKTRCDSSTNFQWKLIPDDAATCSTGSSQCSRGECHAGICRTKAGESCTAKLDLICNNKYVPGTCQGDGRCIENVDFTDKCWQTCKEGTFFCLTCEVGMGVSFPICFN